MKAQISYGRRAARRKGNAWIYPLHATKSTVLLQDSQQAKCGLREDDASVDLHGHCQREHTDV